MNLDETTSMCPVVKSVEHLVIVTPADELDVEAMQPCSSKKSAENIDAPRYVC